MAAEQLQIQVQANVQQAISSLNNFNTQLNVTGNAVENLGTKSIEVLNNQLQRLQRLAQNPNLSTEQYQRLGKLINDTSKEADRLSKSLLILNRSNTQLSSGTGQASTALTNFSRVAQDAPFGLIGIANNIDPLVQSFVQLRKETGSGKAALAALGSSLTGGGGLILAVSLVTSALQFAQIGFDRWFKSTKDTKKETESLSDTISNVTQNLSKEIAQVTKLVELIKSENTSRKLKKEAIDELIKVAPEYFDNLNKENIAIDKLDIAYKRYINTIQTRVRATVLEKQLADIIAQEQEINTLRTVRAKDPLGLKNLLSQNALRKVETAELKTQNTENSKLLNISNQKTIILNELVKLQQEINNLDGQNKSAEKTQSLQEKINDLLKDYKNTLQFISYEEQIKGINLSNERLETNLSFLKRAAELVGLTGDAYKKINKDTQAFAEAAANQKIVEVIKNYKDAITELDIKQAITGQDQLNARINSTTDALIKLRQLGVSDINDEFIKLKNTLNELKTEVGLREFRKRAEDIAKTWNRLQLQIDKLNFNKTKDPLDILKSKIDAIGNAISELKSKGLTEKDLGVAILTIQFEQLGLQYDKLKKTNKALGDEIKSIFESGAVNAFTSLFESIVEGENAFDALRQSVKRLVIELGNAIIKTLVLQAIQNIAAPGTGSIGKIGTSGFLPGVRFDQLRFAFFR